MLTFSLLSFLFTMMAVMFWSMKNKMAANRAGMIAAAGAQEGRSLPVHIGRNRGTLKRQSIHWDLEGCHIYRELGVP